MKKIVLVCWKEELAEERVKLLRAGNYQVQAVQPQGMAFIKAMEQNPPDAIVIDLDRLPSHGREFGVNLRIRKGTRAIPLVFAGGQAEKTAKIKTLLPDAAFTDWISILDAVESAIKYPPENHHVPSSVFAAYAGKPLIEKLGIKPNMQLALLDAPENSDEILGELPEGVTVTDRLSATTHLGIWFTSSTDDLISQIGDLSKKLSGAHLWIAWPKKSSSMKSDLTQQAVREAGLSNGLVDYKICAIDDTWSGLLFKKRM